MTYHAERSTLNRVIFAAVVAALGVSLAACSSSSKKSSSPSGADGGLPATVKVLALTDLTGNAGFAGAAILKGAQLAFDEANAQKYLGSTQVTVSSKDTASNAQTAASLMTQAVADKSVAAVLGPELGTESAPMATIAESAKLPTVFTQSGSDGVVIGPYTFRVTAPQITYFPVSQKYLQSKGVKTVAAIYDSTNPTTTALAKQSLTKDASTYGYSVTDSVAVTSTTQDFSAPITSILKTKPQVVGLFVIGAANATAVTQLRQAGFTGTILAQIGAGSGQLTPAGAAGKNVVWATDYSAANTTPAAIKFGAAFKAKFGTVASDFNAEGYDAGWLIVRAIKSAGAADRVSIQKGMNTVAQQGFDGAEGKLTFDNRDLRVPGVMVAWDGTKEILAP